MTIAPLPRVTLRARAVDALRGAVLDGRLKPGQAVIEAQIARDLDISRAPLREALRQLIDEGLLTQERAWSGVFVTPLTAQLAHELFTMRTAIEILAFEEVWPRRDDAFVTGLTARHRRLLDAIDRGDDPETIAAELAFHGLVYECSGHGLLQEAWRGLQGRLQLYWVAHHAAHGHPGPRRDSHDNYMRRARGEDLDAMRTELRDHMQRGLATVLRFIDRSAPAVATPIMSALQGRNHP
jgi:DNA-binding GntR family transcriptional regulator